MVEPISTALAGIALVKSATSFIKENLNTVNDISGIAKQIDQMFEGQQQINKERSKQANSTANELGLSNVADSIISARLAAEQMQEVKNMINLRFGPTCWEQILMERKRRIDKRKQAIKEAKAAKMKKQKEMYDMVRMVMIGLAVILFVVVAIGITIKFVLAHPVEGDDKSCKLYEPKYYLMCLSEGRGYTDTQLYLDYQLQKDNWIIEKD